MVILRLFSQISSFHSIRHPSVARWSILPLFLVLLGQFTTARAEAFGDFFYTVTNATVTITNYNGPGGEVTIPDVILNKPVTGIGDAAFAYNTNLTSVTIPNSTTRIGSGAFYGCSGLTNVTIPDGVSSIGDSALSGCIRLTSVTIPKSVTSIAPGTFSTCSGLINIAIPNSVTNIGGFAFSLCSSLTNIEFTNSITSIGQGAFNGCNGLTSVSIPNGVTRLGDSVFANCAGLTNVQIPQSVSFMDRGPFQACTNLVAIVVDPLNKAFCSIDGVLFDLNMTTLIQCPGGKIGSYTVPSSVTSISWYAFAHCEALTNVTLPNSIRVIWEYTFYRCTSLTKIILPDGVVSIRDLAFDGCTALTSVSIPNSVTTIYSAFSGCDALLNLTIPEGVQRITAMAFQGCNGLTNVFVSKTVTSIEDSVFSDCASLRTIAVDPLNTNYASLDGVLFNKSQTKLIQYPAGKVGNYVIPNGITNIGNSAFFGSGSVPSVALPESVTKIGDCAFWWCTNLTSLFFDGNAPASVSSLAFRDATNVTVYYRDGTTGWSNTFAGRPTALWVEQPTYQEWAQTTGLLARFPDTSAETDDADGDGLNNLAEMLAGTDPTSPNSTLKFETASRPNDLVYTDKTAIGPDQHALYFQAVPGKKYEIQSVSGIGGTWQTETNVAATTTQKRVVVNKPADQSFYRVVLVP